jgi:Family of unknown function (DUF6088)
VILDIEFTRQLTLLGSPHIIDCRAHPRKRSLTSRSFNTALILSEKQGSISDRLRKPSVTQTIDSQILKRIYGSGRSSVFTPTRFADLGGRNAVDKTLSRLAQSGTIRRLARGVYDYPEIHPVLGPMIPSAESVAAAIAARDSAKFQPAGAYAANLLGLSDQVPAKIVFLTDSASRNVRIGNMTIQLRQTTPRNMAAAGRLSGLLIQALRHLGKEHVTTERVAHLKRTLPAAKRRELMKDLKLAPAWMQPILRELAET